MRTLFAISVLLPLVYGKIFEKCDLATLLETKHLMARSEVKKWVCIAEYESTFNTAAINNFNWDQSKDYGLFQLNNRYWCGDDPDIPKDQNVCGIPCSDLLDDDLTDDIRCARKIIDDWVKYKKVKDGLLAWVAYKNRCVNRNLDEYIKECYEPDTVDSVDSNIIEQSSQDTKKEPPRRASGLGMLTLLPAYSYLGIGGGLPIIPVAPGSERLVAPPALIQLSSPPIVQRSRIVKKGKP